MLTLSALLVAGATRRPEAPAVTDDDGTLNWTQFVARVRGAAAQLQAAGVRPGDRVALWMPNSADYLALIFACARLGALAIHINTRFRAAEIASLLSRSRAEVLVTQWGFGPVDFPDILAGLAPESRTHLRRVIGRRLPADVSAVARIPAERLDPTGDADDAATPEALCLTFTTSGTTSGPKLVVHNQRSIAGHAAQVMGEIGLDRPDSALLAIVPFCGTFGNATAMAAVCGGAHVICVDQFDAARAVALIRRHRVSHAFGGDDLLIKIIEAGQGDRFTTLRMFGFASFTSSAATTAAAAMALGLEPVSTFGSSEMQALFAFARDAHRLRMGGRPVSPQAEVSVRDPDTGEILPHGQSGELCFRGPSRFVGYLENDAATAKATTADDFFRSGDLGHLTDDGFVFESRIGDTLRLGGFLVNPEEIEGFLITLPGVAAAQVVAAAEAQPIAFVTADPAAYLDETAMLEACGQNLARFKVPVRIVVVEAFPTTQSANGEKIQRVKLREMAEALLLESKVEPTVPEPSAPDQSSPR